LSGAARTHRTIGKAIIRIRQEAFRSRFATESAGHCASGTGIPQLKASAEFVDRKTADRAATAGQTGRFEAVSEQTFAAVLRSRPWASEMPADRRNRRAVVKHCQKSSCGDRLDR